jgi:tetratricopeptide (TPR) repeat protein
VRPAPHRAGRGASAEAVLGSRSAREGERKHIYFSIGDTGRALDVLQRNVDLLAAEPTFEQPGVSGLPYAMSCAWGALALADDGDFARAQGLLALGKAAARKAEHTYSLTAAEVAAGTVAALRGDAAEAVATLEPAIATCREKHFAGWVMMAAWGLTIAYREGGRAGDALAVCREGRELKDSTGARVWRGREFALLAEALLANGLVAEARAAALEAIEAARAQGELVSEGLAHYALAGAMAAETPPGLAEAEAELGRAVALLERPGARPLVARAYVRLGEVQAASGQPAAARRSLTTAVAMFHDLGMTALARRAESALGAIVPASM